MTVLNITAGKWDYHQATGLAFVLLGVAIYCYSPSTGGLVIGWSTEWPRVKNWTLAEFLPSKNPEVHDHGPLGPNA